jgi:hypothetical protein
VSGAHRQIQSAADRGRLHRRDKRAVEPRSVSRDERGHLGARLWGDQTERGGDDRGVVDTFVRAIETTKKEGSRLNLLQILKASNYDEDNSDDDGDAGDYNETGEYEETDDCNS